MMTNLGISTRVTRAAFALATVCVVFAEKPTVARSADDNCKQATGVWVDVYQGSGPSTFGTVTNAGFLNGTTETVFNPAFVITPEPTVVSYFGDWTLTAIWGQLKTRSVFLYDLATGQFTIMARINPAISTGRFAGATGVLFMSGDTIGNGLTYLSEVSGEICFANE